PHVAENAAVMLHVRIRPWTGQGLDTAYSRTNAGLIGDGKEADLPGGPHVCAATELFTKARYLNSTYLLAIFLTKQRQRPTSNGAVEVHHGDVQGRISPDLLVDQALNAVQFTLAEAGKMRKIEPQTVRCHQRPGLLDVLAEDLPQGR